MSHDRLRHLAGSERHRGKLDDADGVALTEYGCGDGIIFFVKVVDDRLVKVRYLLKGCQNLAACCSAAAALTEGKEIWEAMLISPRDIEAAVGELPPEEQHTTDYVVEALYRAIRDYQEKHDVSLSKSMLGAGWRSLYVRAQKPPLKS
ncbi:MAG: iron-sulfur cluster assembly scaffold protein [Thermacetogeniaceae bacterium]